jgi:MFS superfamily sulfate permease-like transporter
LGRDPQGDGRWSDVERHPDNESLPGLVVLRPESALFFANADAIRNAVRTHISGDTTAVVLDAETVPAIDITAVGMLTELGDDLRRDGIELVLARDLGNVRDLLRRADGQHALRNYPTVRAAVSALQTRRRSAGR